MKYKIGDKVRIKKDLVVDDYYDGWLFTNPMKKDIESNDYILTISRAYIAYDGKTPVYNYEKSTPRTDGSKWELTEEMIEGLIDPTDREKFEGWMRKLSSLPYDNEVWHAFNYIVTAEPDKDGYDDRLKIVSDFLFAKKMTKAEIEAELGYKIEIVE